MKYCNLISLGATGNFSNSTFTFEIISLMKSLVMKVLVWRATSNLKFSYEYLLNILKILKFNVKYNVDTWCQIIIYQNLILIHSSHRPSIFLNNHFPDIGHNYPLTSKSSSNYKQIGFAISRRVPILWNTELTKTLKVIELLSLLSCT